MLIESLAIGLIWLTVRKKLTAYLKTIAYSGLALPIAAFVLESLGALSLSKGLLSQNSGFWLSLSVEAMLYSLLMAFIGLNHRLKGFKLMGLGLLLNGLVVLSNGGHMPVDGSVLLSLGYETTYQALAQGQIFAHELIHNGTRLAFLADVIHLPPPYPFPKSVSLGDFLLGFGVLYHLASFSTVQPPENQAAKEVG